MYSRTAAAGPSVLNILATLGLERVACYTCQLVNATPMASCSAYVVLLPGVGMKASAARTPPMRAMLRGRPQPDIFFFVMAMVVTRREAIEGVG